MKKKKVVWTLVFAVILLIGYCAYLMASGKWRQIFETASRKGIPISVIAKASTFKISLSGKVIDDNGNPLEGVRSKITYSSPSGPNYRPPDFAGDKKIEYREVNGSFNLEWTGNTVEILAGKKGYHPDKYFISQHGKCKGNKYENNDIVLVLRKIKTSPLKCMMTSLYNRDRYSFFLKENSGKKGVKFSDNPKPGDMDDVAVIMEKDENGVEQACLETSPQGGIIIVKPHIPIHKMTEAPESGYRQKLNADEIGEASFYLKTAEGLYVKGEINTRFNHHRNIIQFDFTPCAIQPDGSRNLETVDEKLNNEIFSGSE